LSAVWASGGNFLPDFIFELGRYHVRRSDPLFAGHGFCSVDEFRSHCPEVWWQRRVRTLRCPEHFRVMAFAQVWFQTKTSNPADKAKYDFTIEIVPYALLEYEKWETHQDWNKQNISEKTKKGGRALRRDKTKKITWISPSILFPIMGAMSEFVTQGKKGKWQINKPKIFKEEEMIRRAAIQFHGHESNPILMGRSESAYDALRIYPQTLVDVLHNISTAS
jgi:hypothetical protein